MITQGCGGCHYCNGTHQEAGAQRGAAAHTTSHCESEGPSGLWLGQPNSRIFVFNLRYSENPDSSVAVGTKGCCLTRTPLKKTHLLGGPEPHPLPRAHASASSQWSSSHLKNRDLFSCQLCKPQQAQLVFFSLQKGTAGREESRTSKAAHGGGKGTDTAPFHSLPQH